MLASFCHFPASAFMPWRLLGVVRICPTFLMSWNYSSMRSWKRRPLPRSPFQVRLFCGEPTVVLQLVLFNACYFTIVLSYRTEFVSCSRILIVFCGLEFCGLEFSGLNFLWS